MIGEAGSHFCIIRSLLGRPSPKLSLESGGLCGGGPRLCRRHICVSAVFGVSCSGKLWVFAAPRSVMCIMQKFNR